MASSTDAFQKAEEQGIVFGGADYLKGCSNKEIVEVNIPQGVVSISSRAFCNCTRLSSVIIPSSVTSIGGMAFFGCTALNGIKLPRVVRYIGEAAFVGVAELYTDSFDVLSPFEINETGFLLDKDAHKLLYAPPDISGSISIPDSVQEIASCAFYGCKNLTKVSIPESVHRIGSCAFKDCTGLKDVEIPVGITEIEDEAFCGCSQLTWIEIFDNVDEIQKIGNDVFKGAGCEEQVARDYPHLFG